jgi:hypothetical protein
MADKKETVQEQPAAPEEEGGGQPERMDAPNQQAVGQPHPSEEGTGGEPGDITKANFAFDSSDEPGQEQEGQQKSRAGRARETS